ncbi:uncharacterized protein LOC128868401 [Anastrepha ludens]|uniref:uncharacterized protein LOC128868401 n=1 Tax=Anastrepha ludens TaxID=28586 RepID=UPI0023B196F7|nr:uncharacterized protein LOC128868401 [Anastrepha ludens]
MSYLRSTTMICLFTTLICLQMAISSARSVSDIRDLDNDIYKGLDSQLASGYYYISDGRITPISSSIRRKDYGYSNGYSVYFQPIVRVKHQHTRKKLFVPNLFG